MTRKFSRRMGRAISCVLLFVPLSGCQLFASAQSDPLIAQQLFAERDCPIPLAGPYPATALYASIDDLGISAWQKALRGTDADSPKRMLVLIHIGQQPTPGHRISLQSAAAQNSGLQLAVTRDRPDPNRMYAQVITSPCILISVPADRYRDVDVIEVPVAGA